MVENLIVLDGPVCFQVPPIKHMIPLFFFSTFSIIHLLSLWFHIFLLKVTSLVLVAWDTLPTTWIIFFWISLNSTLQWIESFIWNPHSSGRSHFNIGVKFILVHFCLNSNFSPFFPSVLRVYISWFSLGDVSVWNWCAIFLHFQAIHNWFRLTGHPVLKLPSSGALLAFSAFLVWYPFEGESN